MLIIALTGGIGSGKTTVAKLFEDLGAPIIDADVIARDALQPGNTPYSDVVRRFGSDVQLANGSINREWLKQTIFSSAVEKKWLESLIHPFVFEEIRNQLKNLDKPYCILVIPLFIETQNQTKDLVDKLIYVDCSVENQIARVIQRDKIESSFAQQIITQQSSREDNLNIADNIIQNDGEIEQLHEQVVQLDNHYRLLGVRHV